MARPTLGLVGSPLSTEGIYLANKLATPLGSFLLVFHSLRSYSFDGFSRMNISLFVPIFFINYDLLVFLEVVSLVLVGRNYLFFSCSGIGTFIFLIVVPIGSSC